MRAHRARVHVDADHELRVTLPPDFPTGEAELLIVEMPHAMPEPAPRLSVDELLAARLVRPTGVGPVSLDDIERAIALAAVDVRGI